MRQLSERPAEITPQVARITYCGSQISKQSQEIEHCQQDGEGDAGQLHLLHKRLPNLAFPSSSPQVVVVVTEVVVSEVVEVVTEVVVVVTEVVVVVTRW